MVSKTALPILILYAGFFFPVSVFPENMRYRQFMQYTVPFSTRFFLPVFIPTRTGRGRSCCYYWFAALLMLSPGSPLYLISISLCIDRMGL